MCLYIQSCEFVTNLCEWVYEVTALVLIALQDHWTSPRNNFSFRARDSGCPPLMHLHIQRAVRYAHVGNFTVQTFIIKIDKFYKKKKSGF